MHMNASMMCSNPFWTCSYIHSQAFNCLHEHAHEYIQIHLITFMNTSMIRLIPSCTCLWTGLWLPFSAVLIPSEPVHTSIHKRLIAFMNVSLNRSLTSIFSWIFPPIHVMNTSLTSIFSCSNPFWTCSWTHSWTLLWCVLMPSEHIIDLFKRVLIPSEHVHECFSDTFNCSLNTSWTRSDALNYLLNVSLNLFMNPSMRYSNVFWMLLWCS